MNLAHTSGTSLSFLVNTVIRHPILTRSFRLAREYCDEQKNGLSEKLEKVLMSE
jgi:hypothetical protein